MAADAFSLAGKIALITGASRGLGFAIARAMGEAGARVVLNGRDAATLKLAMQALTAQGLDAETQCFDVTDEAAARRAIELTVMRHGKLDALIGNAGIQHRRKLDDFSTSDWQRVLDTNLTACFTLAREAARVMRPRGMGTIIFNASIMGPRIARPGVVAHVKRASRFG